MILGLKSERFCTNYSCIYIAKCDKQPFHARHSVTSVKMGIKRASDKINY